MSKTKVVAVKDGKTIVILDADFTEKKPPVWFKKLVKKEPSDEQSTNK